MKTLNETIKEAYDNLVIKLKSYLTHLFAHSIDSKKWNGSRFNMTSVGLASILNGYWPDGKSVVWSDVTEKFRGVLLPKSFCFQTKDPKGAEHILGAKDIDDFPDDKFVQIRKEEFEGKDGIKRIVYSLLAKATEQNCHTDIITVILQDDNELGLVPATMHPGDPLPSNTIKEGAVFNDGERIQIFKAKLFGFKTVKLSFN